MIRKLKKIILAALICGVLLFAFVAICNSLIINTANPFLYQKVENVPKSKVGLLLGTSKYVGNGNINQFYAYRINAAVALYKAGKIEFVLVSGDNGTKAYNEPETIKKDLIEAGIPAEKIFLDYAGFRTYDSVVRAKKIFGLKGFIVISQEFHNQRAVYIARKKGLDAYAFNAQSVGKSYGFKTMQREKLAKVKAVLDLVVNKNPKFLGEKIVIE